MDCSLATKQQMVYIQVNDAGMNLRSALGKHNNVPTSCVNHCNWVSCHIEESDRNLVREVAGINCTTVQNIDCIKL